MQFLAVELHGAVLEAALAQFLGHGVELDQFIGVFTLVGVLLRGGWSGLACAVDHAVVFQQLLHLFVGVAAVAADDGVGNMELLDVGLVIEQEDDAVAELLLVGA